jgi:hypothetical protein
MRRFAACCAMTLAIAVADAAAQAKNPGSSARAKVERLACAIGSEDRQARIAVELVGGRVNRFAYYSKWKPRTCSMEIERDDAYSAWEDTGSVTVVRLAEEKGAFLIDHGRGRYHFIFRDVDRRRYCGMEGTINGTLTIWRGKSECAVHGVMDEGEDPVAARSAPEEAVAARLPERGLEPAAP